MVGTCVDGLANLACGLAYWSPSAGAGAPTFGGQEMRAHQWMAAMIVVAALGGAAQVAGAQVVDEDGRLAQMAADAESVEQHARVAEQYRDRAQVLDTQATRYERTARKLEAGWYPHEHKAAPMLRAGYSERQQAARARRAAREARLLAQRHGQIAADLRNAP